MVHQLGVLHLVLDGSFQLRVPSLVQGDAWEQVVDEGEEERLVLVHQFGEVHVTQHSHLDGLFCVIGGRTLDSSQGTEHREDVTQTEIVVHL